MARRIQDLAGRRHHDVSLLQPVRTVAEIAAEFQRRGQPITAGGVSFMLRQAERKIRLALMEDEEVRELVKGRVKSRRTYANSYR